MTQTARLADMTPKQIDAPLIPTTKTVLKAWLADIDSDDRGPLFPSTTGNHLSRDAIERRLARHLTAAGPTCPSLQAKRVTMHTLRHTAAMRLLLAGNDTTVIALWLGHEQVSTTTIYLHADMTHKPHWPLHAKPGRYQPPDALIAFLESL